MPPPIRRESIARRLSLALWWLGQAGFALKAPSGKIVYADYKGTRSSRPDLLKEQWPEFEPLDRSIDGRGAFRSRHTERAGGFFIFLGLATLILIR